MSVFQDKLRECRKEKGYTQEKLCELLNVSRDTLSKWENGSRSPDLNELLKMCDIFKCDLDYLAGRIEQPTHALQDISDITGLSIESVYLLRTWNTDCQWYVEPPRDPFTGEVPKKYLRSNIDYLNTLLEKYPELLYDIDAALVSTNKEKNNNSKSLRTSTDRDRKILCMKVALNLWNYIDTGKKNHPIEKQNISKFASDFIYERLSFLETALHNKHI